MTKRKSSKKQSSSNNSTQIMGIIAAVVVVAVGILLVLNSNNSGTVTATISPQKISPDNYVSTYTENASNHVLIDVRTPQEFASGHIAGSINIPVEELERRISEVPGDKDIVVYCRSGNRSATASSILSRNGFNSVYDMGGIIAWQQAGYPIE